MLEYIGEHDGETIKDAKREVGSARKIVLHIILDVLVLAAIFLGLYFLQRLLNIPHH
jgi:hypothetical protein